MIHPNEPPETPDWTPEPHTCPVFDLADHVRKRAYSAPHEVPDNITLGEN